MIEHMEGLTAFGYIRYSAMYMFFERINSQSNLFSQLICFFFSFSASLIGMQIAIRKKSQTYANTWSDNSKLRTTTILTKGADGLQKKTRRKLSTLKSIQRFEVRHNNFMGIYVKHFIKAYVRIHRLILQLTDLKIHFLLFVYTFAKSSLNKTWCFKPMQDKWHQPFSFISFFSCSSFVLLPFSFCGSFI